MLNIMENSVLISLITVVIVLGIFLYFNIRIKRNLKKNLFITNNKMNNLFDDITKMRNLVHQKDELINFLIWKYGDDLHHIGVLAETGNLKFGKEQGKKIMLIGGYIRGMAYAELSIYDKGNMLKLLEIENATNEELFLIASQLLGKNWKELNKNFPDNIPILNNARLDFRKNVRTEKIYPEEIELIGSLVV